MNTKIKSVSELTLLVESHRKHGKRVVLCHGVFDLLHPGHIRHLQSAKNEGDVLVVTITADSFVNKGPGRPAFNQELRAESLAALQFVDHVAINEAPNAIELIQQLRPNIYVKGSDYVDRDSDVTRKIYDEEQAILSVGGRIHFTNDITFSSSHLINNFVSVFPTETEEWLRNFRKKFSAGQVLSYLDKISNLKTLVIGEAIIDEYVFCESIGKSTKDPILASLYKRIEAYGGGSLAVANHVSGLTTHVGLATYLGDLERREEFCDSSLRPNVNAHYFTRPNTPTIHKRRFLDSYTGTRLFELYVMNDAPLADDDEKPLRDWVDHNVKDFDVVIVMDYGHGMMTPKVVDAVCDGAKFLAVNTQANAGNRGFNTISRYKRADYVCLANHEIALETRMRHSPLPDLILEVTRRLNCSRFTVTQGKSGSIHYEADSGFVEAPALATVVTDRVGAGDAVMAMTSLLVSLNAPWEIVGFLGNLSGAQMVRDLGNRVVLDKVSMHKQVTALLK